MKTYWFAVACVAGAVAQAHHSPSATYFLDQQMVLHGTIAEFLLRNPHSCLLVDAPDETGIMQSVFRSAARRSEREGTMEWWSPRR